MTGYTATTVADIAERARVSPDTIYATVGRNATEHWVLLVRERGWTAKEFCDWLIDAWTRLLLRTR